MEKMMRRYAVLGMIGLAASGAWAQQATPPAQPPTPAASDPSSKAVVAMESPRAGDYWNYEVRDEITGKITATRSNVVTEVSEKGHQLAILGHGDLQRRSQHL
jgi:hypothetical protein